MKKSLISAIKKLLAKLGAEEVEGNNLVDVIDNGADAIAAQSSSGGGAFVVNMVSHGFEQPITLDKTWREIKDAFDNNIPVMLKNVSGMLCYWLVEIQQDRQYVAAFMGANSNESVFKQYTSDTETGTLTETDET